MSKWKVEDWWRMDGWVGVSQWKVGGGWMGVVLFVLITHIAISPTHRPQPSPAVLGGAGRGAD